MNRPRRNRTYRGGPVASLAPAVSILKGGAWHFAAMRMLPVLALLLALSPVVAPGAAADDDEDDHDRARALAERGAIRPLAEVLARLAREVPGDVVGIDLDEDDGRYEYEFTVVTPDGRVFEVEMDAATLRILDVEEDD